MSDIADAKVLKALRQELVALTERGEAVLLFSPDGTRVLWATPAGASLLGAASPEAAMARVLDPRLFPVDRLAAVGAELVPSPRVRLERLRATVGRRTETLTLALRKVVTPGTGEVLLAVALGGPRLVVRGQALAAPPPDALFTPPAQPGPLPPPVSIEAIRERAGGRDLKRFVWHTDAGDLFTLASPELANLVGEGCALRTGDTPGDLLARGVRDPAGALLTAFAARKTFTGLALLWPVAGIDGALAVAWSGTPVFSPDRGFEGFRGFGLVRLDRLHPLDLPPAAAQDAAAPDGVGGLAGADAGTDDASLLDGTGDSGMDAVDAGAASHGPVAAPLAPPVPAPVETPAADRNVVQLRAPLNSSRLHEPPGLSRSERHAFREIARALGARVEGDEPAQEPLSRAPAAPAIADLQEPVGPAKTPVLEGAALDADQPPATAFAPAADLDLVPDEAAAEATGDLSAGEAEGGGEPLALAGVDSAEEAGEATPAEPDDVVADSAGETGEASPPAAAFLEKPAAQAEPGPEPAPSPTPPATMDPNIAMLLDRLPVGIMVSRGDVPILMNRTLLDLLGYEDADGFHAEGGIEHLFEGRLPDGFEGGGGDTSTVGLLTRDGETVPVDARLQTVTWDGLPATLMSFRRAIEPEVAARIKAVEREVSRRDTENRELRAILDTATDGVVVLDETGRIMSINRAAEALFGYDQQEVAGEMFISLFAPDSHAAAMDYLEGLKSNGVASLLNDGREVIGRVRQGGRIPLFMTLGAVSEAPERKFCAVLRDITPWKKAESDLLEAKKAAETASAQKSDFLAKISHEVRTPLSAIIGFAEVMIEERFGPIGNERYLEYLRDIHASGGHVVSLVNDLLDLSKIEAGRFDLTFVSVDINEVVSRCVAMMQPQAGTGRVVLRSSLSPRVPAVVADERSLRQIVLNILSNAIKFTDPGGQVIISTTFTDRGEVAVRVRDTGIGMSEKEIETALEPFRQIATARRAGGTGLGLPLTKALVEANRASLTIRSAKDAGTLVEVTFPTTRVLSE